MNNNVEACEIRDEFELEAQGRIIKFIIYNRYWCEVCLLVDGESIVLGGDAFEIIKSKLLISFVPESNRKFFIYQGMELFSIFNLMGPEAVVAGRERENFGIELIFISNEGNMTSMLTLAREDIVKWISKLMKN